MGCGGFKRIELKGPPDLDTWLAAFMVLRAALIMLGACGPNVLDRYAKMMVKYAKDYGRQVWHL